MSDTPSESAGQEEPTAYAPSGLRRSTYTPPPADAPLPVWDDDALAAALEEQVRTYTAPITLPVLNEAGVAPTVVAPTPVVDVAPTPAPAPASVSEAAPATGAASVPAAASVPQGAPAPEAGPAPEAPAPPPRAEEAPTAAPEPASAAAAAPSEPVRPFSWDAPPAAAEPPTPTPASEPAASPEPAPGTAESAPAAAPAPTPAAEPDHVAVDPYTEPPTDDDQLIRDLEGASTADAMHRLEEELHRRAVATGQIPVAPVVAPFFAGEPPVSPPAPGPDPDPASGSEPAPAPSAETDAAPAAAAPARQPAPSFDDLPTPTAEPEPWSTAPPPYAPPTLVDPAAPPSTPAPGGRLLPPPTDLPDVAHRAELPPPPGYADDGSPVPVVAASAPAPVAPSGWDQLLADVVPVVPAPAPVPPFDTENDDVVDEGDRMPPIDGAPVPPPSAEPEQHAVATPPPPAALDIIDPQPQPQPGPAEPSADPVESAAPDARDPEQEPDRSTIDRSMPEPSAPEPSDSTPESDPVDLVAPSTLDPTASPAAAFPPAAEPDAGPDAEPRGPAAFAVETASAEPTPREQRVGRAARLFWLWFAANASVVSVALGAVMIGMGMSLRQAVVAVVIGIALSFVPLGFTTLAGKWNAQPTLVLSRAAFGVRGNVLPTVLAILVRVFWGGVLLWLLGDAVGRSLVVAKADGGFGATRWAIIAIAVALVLTGLVAAFGYGLLARVQLVLSIVAGVLIVVAAAVTLPQVHLDVALTHQDGSWLLVVGGAVLVFSFIGLAWAFSGSDVARYQRPGGSGASSMLWATFGATIPPFLLIGWGALLAASDPRLAVGLATRPFDAIAGVLPSWALVPLLLAAVVGLLSGTALTVYSGGFALQNLTPQLPRVIGVVVAALLSLVLGAVFTLLDTQARTIVTDLAVTLAVPVAAWTGIFAAEMMIRQRRFHSGSLLAAGGVYPTVRWPNLVGLVVISAVGYAFVAGGQPWLGWEGFGWRLLGVAAGDPLASVDLGVVIALVLGIVLPLASAVPVIRRQESVHIEPLAARI